METIELNAAKAQSLQEIVDELKLADYRNNDGQLIQSRCFIQLEQLARPGANNLIDNEDGGEQLNEQISEEPFHIEADIYDSGDYANLLVIPSNRSFIVVGNNEHLATLVKTCDDPACWSQQDGSLEDEVVEKLGEAIDSYSQSF